MEEKIKEELEKFTNIRESSTERLCVLLLMDVMRELVIVTREGDKEKKDYSKFDAIVNDVKIMLESITIPDVDTIASIKESVESVEHIQTECDYSIRTLTWMLEDVLNKDKEKGE